VVTRPKSALTPLPGAASAVDTPQSQTNLTAAQRALSAPTGALNTQAGVMSAVPSSLTGIGPIGAHVSPSLHSRPSLDPAVGSSSTKPSALTGVLGGPAPAKQSFSPDVYAAAAAAVVPPVTSLGPAYHSSYTSSAGPSRTTSSTLGAAAQPHPHIQPAIAPPLAVTVASSPTSATRSYAAAAAASLQPHAQRGSVIASAVASPTSSSGVLVQADPAVGGTGTPIASTPVASASTPVTSPTAASGVLGAPAGESLAAAVMHLQSQMTMPNEQVP